MEKESNQKIDIVLPWVDGSDSDWRRERAKWQGGSLSENADDREERYRDYGLLRYWFRGIEECMPWVRKIHFIHYGGRIPDWINTEHPKLDIVCHSDYIPSEYLPTFSSHVIELNLFRIKDLTENFIYFNDDMFMLQKSVPEDWFRKGLPVDMISFCPVLTDRLDEVMPYIRLNNSVVLTRHFDKKEVIHRLFFKLLHIGYPPLIFFYNLAEMVIPRFSAFLTWHDPSPLKKSYLKKIWEEEPEIMHSTSMHKFRDPRDVSQYLVREWIKLSGEFVPANVMRRAHFMYMTRLSDSDIKKIEKRRIKCVCINDSYEGKDNDTAALAIKEALSKAFPHRSSFELS